MKNPVIAIGLHAFSPVLFETWTAQGHLKNLARLRQQGAYGRLDYSESINDVHRWTTFAVGCFAGDTGHRSRLKFQPDTYTVQEYRSYDYAEYPPFYALGEGYRTVVHQVPLAKISDQVHGLQLLNNLSHPPELVKELKSKYGKAPHYKEYSCWWERTANLRSARKEIRVGVDYHIAICKDLLGRETWDLFLTVIEEAHGAGHDFWHLCKDTRHPLHQYMTLADSVDDPLLETYKDVDDAVGQIIASAPENARILVFSIDGMGANTTDLPSTLFLGEFLYRFNFPGKVAIAPGNIKTTPPPPITAPKRQSWAGEIWQLKHDLNPITRLLRPWTPGKYQDQLDNFSFGTPRLASPYQLLKQIPSLFWQPAIWYSPLWPKMKAFALPSFSSGQIRINLRGRDSKGIVGISEYDDLCDQLIDHLHRLKDARTGQPIVEKITRTREDAADNDPKLPDADLLIKWVESSIDVVDSPDFGRTGPVPFCNTGGHKPIGFALVSGPGINPGKLSQGHIIDLAPTVLAMMGAPIPQHIVGKPLVQM